MSYYNDTRRFNSPPARFQGGYQNQSTPKMHHGNNFHRGSPYPRSPIFNNQPNMSFNSPPYHQMGRNPSHSFNSAASSPDRWSANSNKSFSSNSSGSYFADVSQMSPYNSPIRSNGSPYYPQNKNKRFQDDYMKNNKHSKMSNQFADNNLFNRSKNNFPVNACAQNFPHRKGKRNFQSPELRDSNPGHSNNMRDYVHPSMLEDPWKDLMAAREKKT